MFAAATKRSRRRDGDRQLLAGRAPVATVSEAQLDGALVVCVRAARARRGGIGQPGSLSMP
jgi:hypothetical protein